MAKVEATVFSSDAELGRAAAREIFEGIRQAADMGRDYVLGCPGGRSPRSTYHALASMAAASQQSLRHLFIAMMDEYVVPSPTGEMHNVDEALHFSCRGFASREIRDLLNISLDAHLQIPYDHVLVPNARRPLDYEEHLRDIGVNCFLLASGTTDGHVAFNGRGTARGAVTRVTQLAYETRRDNLSTFPQFNSLSEVPDFGVTVGPQTIVAVSAKTIMLLQGSHKREAYQHIATAEDYTPDWPATIISECAAPKIFVDSDAAAKI